MGPDLKKKEGSKRYTDEEVGRRGGFDDLEWNNRLDDDNLIKPHERTGAITPVDSSLTDNQRSLREQESATDNSEKSSRDIGARERSDFGGGFDDMDNKRANAQNRAKNKQNSFWSRRKNAIIGWGIGGLLVGSVSIMSFPPFAAIAQFGAIANWLQQTTQTVHDLATGARTVRNVAASARVAARAAVSSGLRTHIQTGRVGTFNQIVVERYVSQLEEKGVTVQSSNVFGVFNGISLDLDMALEMDVFSRPGLTEAAALDYAAMALNMNDLPQGTRFIDGKIVFPDGAKYSDVVKVIQASDALLGQSKTRLGAAIKARYTARMMGVYAWYNPLGKLNTKAEKSLIEWWNKRKGEQAARSETLGKSTGATDPDTDEPTQASQDGEAKRSSIETEGASRAASGTPKALKLAGGVSAGAGVASLFLIGICSMIAAKDAHAENAFALATTMMAMFRSQLANWGDIQASFSNNGSGNISWEMLDVLSKDLYNNEIPDDFETNDEGEITKINSYRTESWTYSPAYQATMNGKADVNTDGMPQQVVNMYKEDGGWAADAAQFFDLIPGADIAFKGLCSEVGGWILTVLSSLSPQAIVTNILGLIVTSIPAVQEKINSLLATIFQIGTGIPLDPSTLTPAQTSDTLYRAGELSSNTMFATEGGTVLSPAEAYQNRLVAQEYLNNEWNSRSLADRLFDATDSRSALAKLFNESGINTSADSAGALFANVAKVIGAIPSFLGNGLFGNRSTQVSAATGVAYDTGAPVVQLRPAFLDIVGGGSDADTNGESNYDWYVNFTGYKTANPNTKVVTNNVVDLLGGSDGQKYRDYAKECLGTVIGDESDGYKVKAFESGSANDQLLVGFHGVGSWQTNDCSAKVDSYPDKDNYQRIALYTWDYQILASTAWGSLPSDDPESQKLYNELFSQGGGAST